MLFSVFARKARTGGRRMDIDLNVEGMSREVLEAKYFDLADRIVSLTEDNDDLLNDLLIFAKKSRSSPQVAMLIRELLRGGVRRSGSIEAVISKKEPADLLRNSAGRAEIVSVIVCHARKFLKPHNIEIENVWGQGYIMRPDHIKKLKDLIDAD